MSKIFGWFIFHIFYYFIFSQICKENENFCLKCDKSNSFCFRCQYSIFIPDENGGCIGIKKCRKGENYCDECNEDETLCKICEKDYFPDENGACSYINNCELSYNNECIKCKNDYILVGKQDSFKICKSILSTDLKNCKTIDKITGLCEVCQDGYYLSRSDKKCIETENCYESLYGKCLTCDNGYYLNKKEDKCIKKNDEFFHCKETINGEKCDNCDSNYFLDEEGKCVSTKFCQKSKNSKCIECLPNYYLTQNGEECSTEENCFSADKELGICIWCKSNYYLRLSDKKCILNTVNNDYKFCREVTDKCISCESSYFLGLDNKCTITKNCLESENGICVQCSEGFYLGKDNKCTNYEYCAYSNFHYDCLECEYGYLWNITNNKCEKWDEKNYGCKIIDENGETCNSCNNDFYLNETDHKCYDNTDNNNYYKCSLVANNICMKCLPNYFLDKNYKCTTIFNCEISLNENNCEKCLENYCLDRNKKICQYNGEINGEEDKKYFRCAKTNEQGNSCSECEQGLTLNEEGLCINEEDCCEMEDFKCVECINKKHPLKSSCLNSIFGCVETKDENCYRCDDIFNFNNCTECYDGYILNEGICLLKS